jgi:hypothetical protein
LGWECLECPNLQESLRKVHQVLNDLRHNEEVSIAIAAII